MRRFRFFQFNRHIRQAKKRIKPTSSDNKKRNVLAKYDYVFYGSDQIWNPEFHVFSDVYLGKYADRRKNIALAASFGISELPGQVESIFQKGLNNFAEISVREESGQKLVEQLTKRSSEVLLDPTFALLRNDWEILEKKVKIPSSYVLVCILGKNMPANIEKSVAKKGHFIIKAGYDSGYGPEEFLYLIHHAEAIYTDSFHATAFSIIYQKTLYLFERDGFYSSMVSRMNTLFDKLGIQPLKAEDCLYVDQKQVAAVKVQEKILSERKKIIDFVNRSVKNQ